MILIINGPSGSGKTTLGRYLKDRGIEEVVSSTTRKKREGEKEGTDYYFLTEEEFSDTDMIEESIYAGNHYGVSRKEAEGKLSGEKPSFAVLDIRGVKKFREIFGNGNIRVIYIDVTPDKLKERMIKRGDSPQNVIKRMENYSSTGEGNNIRTADMVVDNNGTLDNLKVSADNIIKLIENL